MEIKKGNIFTTNCQTIVNTVNCVGVMGAGIAFEFKLRYPDMYEQYVKLCKNGSIQIGRLWIYKVNDNQWILNFPTKKDWKNPTKIEFLEKGLKKFTETYKEKGIKSIAFPLLGASHGGISEEKSLEIMKRYLSNCNIPIEIWFYEKYKKDDLYLEFRRLFNFIDERELANNSGIRIDFVRKVKKALERDDINNLRSLIRVKGIGEVTLEKSFRYIMRTKNISEKQETLFDYEK